MPPFSRVDVDHAALMMFFFTTSMPTPRPDTSVTWSAVEKPGAKIRL